MKDNALLYLLCVALAVTLIVIASLIYSVKNNSSCVGCNGMQSQSYINLPNNIQQNWTHINVVDLFIRCSRFTNKCDRKRRSGNSAGSYEKKISSSFLYALMSPCVNKSHHFSVSSDRWRLIGLFCSNFHLWKNGIQEQGQQNLQRTRTSVLI